MNVTNNVLWVCTYRFGKVVYNLLSLLSFLCLCFPPLLFVLLFKYLFWFSRQAYASCKHLLSLFFTFFQIYTPIHVSLFYFLLIFSSSSSFPILSSFFTLTKIWTFFLHLLFSHLLSLFFALFPKSGVWTCKFSLISFFYFYICEIFLHMIN